MVVILGLNHFDDTHTHQQLKPYRYLNHEYYCYLKIKVWVKVFAWVLFDQYILGFFLF